MKNPQTPGIEAPKTLPKVTTEITMPPYVVQRLRKRADGSVRSRFWFQLPKRLRPEGWPALQQLPIDPAKRTGLCDLAELAAVQEDGEVLYRKLVAARDPAAALDAAALALREAEGTRGTAPWLIAKFKAPPDEDTPASKWHTMGVDSRRNYDYAFRVIMDWSSSRRPQPHPSLIAMKLPQILKLLNRFSSQPSKQRTVKVALHALFDVARFVGLIEGANPIQRVPLSRMNTREPIEWPAELVEQMCKLAVDSGRTSIALFLRIKWWYGWRTRDIVKIKEPQHYSDGVFKFRTGKRGKWVGAEATDDIRELIGATSPLGTHIGRPLVMNEETGLQYNERTLSKHLRRMLTALGRSDLNPGWLRHTVMTELEEAGTADGASAALVGHSPSSHARMKDTAYRVRNPRLANAAVESLKAHRKK